LVIFVSNESENLTEVYFDELRIHHHKTELIQADDYYPFGLTFNSYTRDYSQAQKYKFNQGSELIDELGLNLYNSQNRMYDPILGRFWGIDAMADLFPSITPMIFGFNNPIKFSDPTGLFGCENGDCPDDEPVDNVMLDEVTVTAKRLPPSQPGVQNLLFNLTNSSNPIYRNLGLQAQKGNTNFVQNAFQNKSIHYSSGEALEYNDSEYTQMFGKLMFYGVGGSMIATVGSPLLLDMLSSRAAEGTLNMGREATTQIVTSLIFNGDLSGVDLADISVAGLGIVPSIVLQSTFDYTQSDGLKTTFAFGTKYGKSGASTLIDAGIGSLNGTLKVQMGKANVDKIVIGVMNNAAAPARQALGVQMKNKYE
jgi:RHS repeat-associated protein